MRTIYKPQAPLLLALALAGCRSETGESDVEGSSSTTQATDGADTADTTAAVDTTDTADTTAAETEDGSTGADTGEQPLGAGNHAVYLTMADGTDVAVELWLPATVEAGQPVPTLLRTTRYWREVAWDVDPPPPELDGYGGLTQAVLAQGVAVVVVDARGSGASFGTREIELGPRELADSSEIMSWIAAQPWSNGRIVAWGISYDGDTAELAAAQGNAALVGVATLFGDFDLYLDVARPGGLLNTAFVPGWSERVQALDANDPCALSPVTDCDTLLSLQHGVKPVDGQAERLPQAVAEHADNASLHEAIAAAPFRDDEHGQSGLTLSDVSPYAASDAVERSGVGTYVAASWFDGTTARGALQRWASREDPQQVVIGAWSHAAFAMADPSVPLDPTAPPPITDVIVEMLGAMTPLMLGAPAQSVPREIRYYTINGGGWRTTPTWPPEGITPQIWYLDEAATLEPAAPEDPVGADDYVVDFTATTGQTNRWYTQVTGDIVVQYPDRADEDAKLLTYTTPPLPHDVELTGSPVVDLYVATTTEDAAFFAYLEVVDADGHVTYVSEGQLRAVHRAEPDAGDPPYGGLQVHHTYAQGDAAPMVPGEVARVRFELLPVSVLVPAGDRIRLALAGHDADSFERVPAAGPVAWSVQRSASEPSSVTLPVAIR